MKVILFVGSIHDGGFQKYEQIITSDQPDEFRNSDGSAFKDL